MLTGEWLPKRIANLVRDVPFDAEETFHGETGDRRQETVERDQRAGVSLRPVGPTARRVFRCQEVKGKKLILPI
jgi:hypothetical protein